MKNINILVVFLLLFTNCKEQESIKKEENKADLSMAYVSFGEEIDPSGSISGQEMLEKYQVLKVTDTLQTKFTATVTEICQAKGCWMKLKLEDGSETMVRFKDYGFFMPKDISGREVIVDGKAFIETMSVDDQKHFAKDGGASNADIAQITKPKISYGFEADGVLLKD